MFSHLKAETGARIHGASEATIRPIVVCQVTGDAMRFSSALGYVYVILLFLHSCRIVDDGTFITLARLSNYTREVTYFAEDHYQYECFKWTRYVLLVVAATSERGQT